MSHRRGFLSDAETPCPAGNSRHAGRRCKRAVRDTVGKGRMDCDLWCPFFNTGLRPLDRRAGIGRRACERNSVIFLQPYAFAAGA